MVKHSQSTQNNKFATSLQYLKENGKNEVGFSLADKNQRFLQIYAIILGQCGYNRFHNSLRLFDVLPNFPFTTNETIIHCYL